VEFLHQLSDSQLLKKDDCSVECVSEWVSYWQPWKMENWKPTIPIQFYLPETYPQIEANLPHIRYAWTSMKAWVCDFNRQEETEMSLLKCARAHTRFLFWDIKILSELLNVCVPTYSIYPFLLHDIIILSGLNVSLISKQSLRNVMISIILSIDCQLLSRVISSP
jgi:hypothetical protein